jgi:hypothetical protein
MYSLHDRAKALEDKFAYDQSFQFRAEARRNKLLGLWAASVIGASDAGSYARDLVSSALEGKSEQDLASKLRHDFDAAGVAVADDELHTRMHDMLIDVVREMERA